MFSFSASLRGGRGGGSRDWPAVPLSALSRFELVPEVSGITRYNGERSNTVQAWLTPYTLIAESLTDFRRRLEASEFVLPAGYRMQIGGESEQRSEAILSMLNARLGETLGTPRTQKLDVEQQYRQKIRRKR